MAYTFTPISSNYLTTTAATVTLTIPSGYSDYRIHILSKSNGAVGNTNFTITPTGLGNWQDQSAVSVTNAGTGTTTAFAPGSGSSFIVRSSSNGSSVTNDFGSSIIEFYNLSRQLTGSVAYVTGFYYAGASNQTGGSTLPSALAWGSLGTGSTGAAVTSLLLTPASGSFIAGSRFDIYGILRA